MSVFQLFSDSYYQIITQTSKLDLDPIQDYQGKKKSKLHRAMNQEPSAQTGSRS